MLLIASVVVMGIATIVATVIVILNTQVTIVEKGSLVDKTSGQEISVQSKGTSVYTEQKQVYLKSDNGNDTSSISGSWISACKSLLEWRSGSSLVYSSQIKHPFEICR